eukprot:15303230-Alexandrium_andersonii.AAC.1
MRSRKQASKKGIDQTGRKYTRASAQKSTDAYARARDGMRASTHARGRMLVRSRARAHMCTHER